MRHGAGGVPEPPVLGRELDDVLFAFVADDVAAQASADYEGGVRGHLAGALKELTRLQGSGKEERFHELELFLAVRTSTLEVRAQRGERRHRPRPSVINAAGHDFGQTTP